jgi:hypothetical protein
VLPHSHAVKAGRARTFWNVVAYGARAGTPGGLLTASWVWERIAAKIWFTAPGAPA